MVGLGRVLKGALRHCGAVLGLVVLAASATAGADPGLDWLASQQAPDGSYGHSPSSLATPAQSTAEVLRAQLALQQTAAPGFAPALDFLNARTGADTELIARKVVVNAQLGLAAPVPVFPLLGQLRANRHETGGFGARAGFSPSVFDTAVALEALGLGSDLLDGDAAGAVGFLLARQQPSGAWLEGANEPSVYLTALSMRALVPYRATYTGVAAALTRAQDFLLSRRGADNLWGEELQSATALLALVPVVSNLSLVDASVQALRAQQQASGAWADDTFTTALALQALRAHDARSSGSGPAPAGSVSGYVVRAGSTEPVSGATVTVDQVPGVAVTTNAEGFYVFPGLEAGSYTVTAQRAGFTSASVVVSARSSQLTLAPPLVLSLLEDKGQVRGLVFDAATRQPLQGVQVSLAGAASLSVLTSATGEFDFGPVAPGAYTLRFEKTGYLALSGAATVEAGRTLSAQLGLSKAGGYVDDTPGAVSGKVVDGKTGQPLAGALFDLGGGLSATTGADGSFALAAVPRATYQGTLSAAGYQALTFSLVFAPGASGEVGTLSLYPAAATEPPTSLTLRGLVADGVSGAPIAGATVAVSEAGASTTSGADGRFVLAGLTLKSFQVAVSAPGYAPATYTLQVAAFGEADVTLKLSPPGDGATSSQFAGLVTDAATGAPLAGAQVSVAGTALSATSGADGRYVLSGISSLELVLQASAVGYRQQQFGVKLASHGSYTVNLPLEPVAGDSFQVVSVAAGQPEYGANATALFTARIASLLPAEKDVLVLGEVQDMLGAAVGTVRAYAVGTTTPVSLFTFAAGEEKVLTLPWNTAQLAPGAYRLVVRVAEPGSVSRTAPFGEVLAENAGRTRIVATSGIDGALAMDPPMTQAGLTTPVNFSALVRNAGNAPLPAGAYVLTVKSAKTGLALFTAEATAEALAAGSHASLSFGNWVPSEPGNLPVSVRAKDAGVPGTLGATLYVGDKGTGTFTVSRTVVPEGDQTVRGTISMQGVDTTVGTGTDPLFALVKTSVARGASYVGPQAMAWNETNQCLGCHTQTQGLLGLSSAVQKADVDPANVRYLFNAIHTSPMSDGTIRISHPEFAETQTALGLWSLSDWADHARAFRTKYRASQYLQTQRLRSGDRTHWSPDHASGWWNTDASHTALVVKGYVDVLKSAQKLPAAGVPDYALATAWSLGATPRPVEDLASGPDGQLYLVRSSDGIIHRLDPATGTLTVAASGLGAGIRAVAVAEDGTLSVTRNASSSALTRVRPDGTRTNVAAVGGNLTDARFGPDGWLYLADWNNNRILRVSPTDQVEVYVSGGLLSRPYSLEFDGAGDLLIANQEGLNILKVAAVGKAVTAWADGLAYRPERMMRGPDGSIYVTTQSFEGLIRVYPDGLGERAVHASVDLTGVAAVGSKLYAVNATNHALMELRESPLATAGLSALETELPFATRYLLANNDSDVDNTVHAMRLIGLAEARTVLTDATLLAQIDAKVLAEATLLRARQKVDGGWPRYNSYPTSDPLATSMVGIALEYTNPSPTDQAIRRAIQYLLNKQLADGSWDNFNNGMPTRLAATSFVMVFMPKALDRLGGIDIDLYVETPGNIQLANATATPTSTPGAGGAVTHLWKLPGVTGAGREVQFDLRLLGMALGEERPAASRAYLEFKNAFVDERVQVPLDIPTVRTTSGATLALATDRATYLAAEPVGITATVGNTSQLARSGQVELAIRAAGSTEALVTLPSVPYSNLAAGAQLPLPASWNTGAALPGGYEVYARLLDAQGRSLAEAVAPFTVQAPAAVAASSVGTDRPLYDAWDVVLLSGRVSNVATNVALAPTRVELTVASPTGQVLLSEVSSLTELAPAGSVGLPYRLTLDGAAAGTYPVTLVVRDAFTREVLSTSTAHFEVQRRAIQSLSGTVSVQHPVVNQGEPNVCTDRTRVEGSSPVAGVTLLHRLVRMDTGDQVDEAAETVDLGASGTEHVYGRNIATAGLPLGGYACILQAQVDGGLRTLASVGFRVIEPPIKVSAQLELSGKGRLLVLLDAAAGLDDPFGPSSAPRLAVQKQHLQQLLTAAGWSYTLVESAEAFERELRTGGYAVYALFSEQVKLSAQGQKELREAVFRGEGLLVAGAHDMRNEVQYEPLGVKFIGHLSDATRVTLGSTEFPLLTGTFDLLSGEKPERIERAGAERLGTYGAGATDAVTLATYGRGEAAFAGSDLLAISARDGLASTAADLLRILLERVHPQSLATAPGAVVPVLLTVANQGIAVPVSVQVALPAGVTVVDPGQGTLTGADLGFAFPLAVDEVRTLRFWVRLPATPGALTLTATVTAGTGAQAKTVVAQAPLTVAATASLQDLAAQLDALADASQGNGSDLDKAGRFVTRAVASTDRAGAIREVLQATDVLVGLEAPEVVQARVALDTWLRWASLGSP